MSMWLGAEFVKLVLHDVSLEKAFLGENSVLDLTSAINTQNVELKKMSKCNKKRILEKDPYHTVRICIVLMSPQTVKIRTLGEV